MPDKPAPGSSRVRSYESPIEDMDIGGTPSVVHTEKGKGGFLYRTQLIKPNAITKISPYQARQKTLDPKNEDDAGFIESIRDFGNFQPIVVMMLMVEKVGSPEYMLLAGSRRLEACRICHRDVLAIVFPYNENPESYYDITLIENLQRKNLNFYETAVSFSKKRGDPATGLSVREIAKKISVPPGTVGAFLSAYDSARAYPELDALFQSGMNVTSILFLAPVFESIPASQRPQLAQDVSRFGQTTHQALRDAVKNKRDPFQVLSELKARGAGQGGEGDAVLSGPNSAGGKSRGKSQGEIAFPFDKRGDALTALTGVSESSAVTLIGISAKERTPAIVCYGAALFSARGGGTGDKAHAVAAEALTNKRAARLLLGELKAREAAARLAGKRSTSPELAEFLRVVFKTPLVVQSAKSKPKKASQPKAKKKR